MSVDLKGVFVGLAPRVGPAPYVVVGTRVGRLPAGGPRVWQRMRREAALESASSGIAEAAAGGVLPTDGSVDSAPLDPAGNADAGHPESLPVTVARAPGSAGAVVSGYLRSLVEALLAAEPLVRLDADDAVHQMRVAARRLRSALATYRRLLDRERAERLREELKWLGGALGPLRDAEVIRQQLDDTLDDMLDGLVGDDSPVRARVDATMLRRIVDARRRALEELSSPRYAALVEELRAIDGLVLIRGRTGRRAKKELPKHVRRAHRRLRRAARSSPGDRPTDEQLHTVRKAAKRVRYAAESVADVVGPKADRLARTMEQLQDTLGAHQDTVVIRAVVQTLAADAASAGEDTFQYGRLTGMEECRARAARDAWRRAIDDGAVARPGWLR